MKINKKQKKKHNLLNLKDWLKKVIKKRKTSKSKYLSPPNLLKKRRKLKRLLSPRMRHLKILIIYWMFFLLL
jgi:hypothetical protein